MLRFPNPGSDIDHFVRIFQAIFPTLSVYQSFGLDDISAALVAQNLATSSGHMGIEALKRSTRADRSKDPLYNQSKSYSELYRLLGWMHPRPNSQLVFTFTYLGAHVAEALQDPRALVLECILGIAYPNPIVKVKGDNRLRPFVTFLRTIRDMDSILSRDELIVGPMSLSDDRNAEEYNSMIDKLRGIRGSKSRMNEEMALLSNTREISRVTMGNYTRFPLAALKWSGWAKSVSVKGIYGSTSSFLQVTEAGIERLDWAENATDIRGADLDHTSSEVLEASAKLGFYEMLERAGFDISPAKQLLSTAQSILKQEALPSGKDYTSPILFSPFQELSPPQAQDLFPVVQGDMASESKNQDFVGQSDSLERLAFGEIRLEQHQSARASERREEFIESLFRDALAETGNDIENAVDYIFTMFSAANQSTFYPLVSALFRSLGYECQHSRAGVNYQRWDALIIDERASIPIEIKSPGEELFLSVKAVRQALENKIVLLSRESFPTTKEVTSLVVGYNPPNNRSEVSALIEDIRSAFGITIGVIDFRSLLQMVGAAILQGRSYEKGQMETLYGLIQVSDA